MSNHDDLTIRLELARDAALAAGAVTLEYFQQANLRVERKSDRSPVTIADRSAEQLLRQRISESFPADSILGEEFGATEGDSPWRWILDPIDGTKSFICGVPLYGTLIGVQHQQQSVAGVIHIPALREMVYAAQGGGAWYVRGDEEPAPARVSRCGDLAEGVFLTSQVDGFDGRGAHEAYRQLEREAYITRTWGDCYGYLLVATGRAEAMVDAEMHLWDIAALQPIIEEAGGKLTDWSGEATIYSGDAVATNGAVHEQVMAATRPFARSK